MGDDHTHRVVRKEHHRGTDGPGSVETFEPGDRITPTDAELEAFGDRFQRITDPDADRDGTAETAETETETDPEPADEGDGDAADEEGDEEAPDTTGPAPDPLTEAWVEAADYNDLRSASSRFEDVNGNWGADRLRAELADRAED
jgi:hypothetical protein